MVDCTENKNARWCAVGATTWVGGYGLIFPTTRPTPRRPSPPKKEDSFCPRVAPHLSILYASEALRISFSASLSADITISVDVLSLAKLSPDVPRTSPVFSTRRP